VKALKSFAHLVEIMAELRSSHGCPWDRAQNHASIRPYCIEEAYEVVEAIEEGDPMKLREELGDLILQVVFHAQLAKEARTFDIHDVLQSINEKLVRRHPHVFQEQVGKKVTTPEEVLEKWADIKRREGREHLLDGIPKALPALMRATRVGEKAKSVGFDWKTAQEVWRKVEEELLEVKEVEKDSNKIEEEFGDLLFALVSLARHLKIDAESSLRKATFKFEKRFQWIEKESQRQGHELSDLDPQQLDALWNRAKREMI